MLEEQITSVKQQILGIESELEVLNDEAKKLKEKKAILSRTLKSLQKAQEALNETAVSE